MPDEITPPSDGGTPAAAPAVEPKGTPAPPAPPAKAEVESRSVKSSNDFDAIFEETQKELEDEEAKSKTPPAPVEDEDDEEDDKPEDKPKADDKAEDDDDEADADGDDKPKGDEPAAEAEEDADAAEKTVAEQILELMKNPELLEAALKEADVKTIQELPFIKDLVGRSTQSAFDQAKAAAAKEAFEEKQVNEVLEKGRKAATEVVSVIEQLAKDLEEGAEEFKVPETQFLVDKFNEYADGAVHAYHNKNFGEIADVVYNYPEMKALSEEQQAYLSSFAGKPPAQWLDAHFEVQRTNLWNMAQNDVAQKAQQLIEDRTKTLTEAHKVDIQKLTEKHEKALAKATTKAKEDTRAEVLSEFAKNGSPPKTPTKDSRSVVEDDDIDTGDGSMEAIWRGVKAAQEKSAGV